MLVWLFNVFGVRPAVWFGYVTGARSAPRCVLMFFPYVTGDWSSYNMSGRSAPAEASGSCYLAVLHGLVVLRLRDRGGLRTRSTTTRSATPRWRCARRPLFSVVVYALLPLGLGGTLGTQAIADDPTFIAFYTEAFDELVGDALATVMILS